MIKTILLIIFLTLSSFAVDNLRAQQQDVLYVQTLIEKEETIAKNFEKYLLREFEIPTIAQLQTDDYLGTNFSLGNRMGVSIDFNTSNSLEIKYAITKSEYINEKSEKKYLVDLYNRDLYRDNTYVILNNDTSSSHIEIKLKSLEAKNIFNILTKENKKIELSCKSNLKNVYCNNDEKTIRWYDDSSNWIEYSKKEFKDGNVNISSPMSKEKRKELKVGSHIFLNKNSQSVRFYEED